MLRTFKAQKMIDRIKKEGKEYLLDEQTLNFIRSLDNKVGNDYNWKSVVDGEPLVWIEDTDNKEGVYVALCDCI